MDKESDGVLKQAHAEFNRKNFKQAEELYSQFITSCEKKVSR